MALVPDSTPVGFIGTGVMGRSMAGHLQDAGHPLHVYTRTRAKAQPLLDAGATWHDGPASLARASKVVVTIVGFPSDVQDIYLGADGLVAHAPKGAYLIDMTTSRPSLARQIAEAAQARGLHALDAPVSGGDVGAREARLSIMVGGERRAYDEVLPILQRMGKNIVYQGPAGSGQHTKMVNQIVIAGNMMGVCEAMAYAVRSGLDPATVLESIGGGAAQSWTLNNLAPRIIKGDFAPGFFVKHFIKDMTIASEEAQALGVPTEGLNLAKVLYEKLAAEGGGDLGTQALYKLLEA